MAQLIRKLQGGEKIPSKYGKYIIDGRAVQVNDEILNDFVNWGNRHQSEYKGYFADMADALRRGEDVIVDTLRQTSSVVPTNLNERQRERMTRNPNMWEGADMKNARHAISLLSNFTLEEKEKPVEKPELTNIDFTRRRSVDYDKIIGDDKTESNVFSTRASNYNIIRDLESLSDYFSLGDEGKNKYSLNLSKADENDLRSVYNENPKRFNQLIDSLRSGKELNERDREDLEDLLIFIDSSKPSDSSKDVLPEGSWSATPEDTKDTTPLFTYKDNGDLIVNNKLYNDNIDLSKGVHLLNEYSPIDKNSKYFNGALVDGTAYTLDEIQANKNNILDKLAPFIQASRADDFDTMGKSGVNYLWGRQNPFLRYDPNKHYSDIFHRQLTSPTAIWDLTKEYSLPGGQRAIAFYDSSENTKRNYFGLPESLSYMLYDPKNTENPYQTYSNLNEIPSLTPRDILDNSAQELSILQDTIETNNNFRYAPIETLSSINEAGVSEPKYSIYRGIDDNNTYIKINDKFYVVENPFLLRDILSKKISRPTKSDIEKLFPNKMYRNKDGKYVTSSINPFTSGTFIPVPGIETDKFGNPKNLMESEEIEGSGLFGTTYKKYDFVKHLDKLQEYNEQVIERRQYGGILHNVRSQTTVNDAVSQIAFENLKGLTESPTVKEAFAGGDNLNSADKWAMGALAGDIAGLVASFAPGAGNIVAGVSGAASSGAQFISDIKRDGLDWGDAVRLGGSLALDVVSLLPGAGIAGKTGKVIKAVNAAVPVLGAAFAAANSTEALQALKNIQEKGATGATLDDWRALLIGIQGVVAGGKHMGRRFAGKQSIKVKSKIDEAGYKKKIVDAHVNKGLDDETLNKVNWATKDGNDVKINDYNKAFEALSTRLERNTLRGKKFAGSTQAGATNLSGRMGMAPRELRTDFSTNPILRNIQKKFAADVELISPWKAGNKYAARDTSGNIIPEQYNATILNKGKFVRPITALTTDGKYINIPSIGTPYAFNTKHVNQRIRDIINKGNINMSRLPTVNGIAGTPTVLSYGSDIIYFPSQRQALSHIENLKFKQGGMIPKYQSGRRLEDMNAITDWGNTWTDFSNRTFTQDDLNLINAQHKAKTNIGNQRIGSRVLNFQTIFDNPLFSNIIGKVAGTPGYSRTATYGDYIPTNNGWYNRDSRVGGITRSWMAASDAMKNYFNPENVGNKSNLIFNSETNSYELRDPVPDDMNLTRAYSMVSQFDSNTPLPLSTTSQKIVADTERAHIGRPKGEGILGLIKGIDPDDLIGAGQMIHSLVTNRRSADALHRANRAAAMATKAMPTEVYNRYSDWGITNAHQRAAQAQYNVKPATSDYLTQFAIEQDAKSKGDAISLEGSMKSAQNFAQWRNEQDNLRRNYSSTRDQTAHENRQRGVQSVAVESEIDNMHRQADYQSIDNFTKEMRAKLAQDRNRYEAIQGNLYQRKMLYDQQLKENELRSDWEKRFNSEGVEEKDSSGKVIGRRIDGTFYRNAEDWIKTNPQEYNRLAEIQYNTNVDIERPYNEFLLRLNRYSWRDQIDYLTPPITGGSTYYKYKKGAKVTKREIDVQGTIQVNHDKETAKALQALSKDVIRLILEMTKK